MRGIYSIVNTVNGKQYIGSAINIQKRWGVHIRALKSGTHKNPHLQSAFNVYGIQAFEFRILELVDDKEGLIPAEQHWIDVAKGLSVFLYNIAQRAGSNLGLKPRPRSEDFRRKMSLANLGRPSPIKGKQRKSVCSRGHARTPESLFGSKGCKQCSAVRYREKHGLPPDMTLNVRKQATCKRGHERTADNLTKGGACRACQRLNNKGPQPIKLFCLRGHPRSNQNLSSNGTCRLCHKIIAHQSYLKKAA